MLQIPIQTRMQCCIKSKPMTFPSFQGCFRRPVVACKNARVDAKLLRYSRHKKIYITCAKAFVVESFGTAQAWDEAAECWKVEACSSMQTYSPSLVRSRLGMSGRPWIRIRYPLRTRLLLTPMSLAGRLLVARAFVGVCTQVSSCPRNLSMRGLLGQVVRP